MGHYQKSIFGSGCLCEPIQIIIPIFKLTTREEKKPPNRGPSLSPRGCDLILLRAQPVLILSRSLSICLDLSHRSTRARFSDAGMEDEIGMALDGIMEGWITVDRRKVVQLHHLQGNFHDSHTVFIDGGSSLHCDSGTSLFRLDGSRLVTVLGSTTAPSSTRHSLPRRSSTPYLCGMTSSVPSSTPTSMAAL
jgi:hypothetical protein